MATNIGSQIINQQITALQAISQHLEAADTLTYQDVEQLLATTNLGSVITSLQGLVTQIADTKATYTTALTGANNDLKFTSVLPGTAGNIITVTYVDPGGVSATLGVVVTGSDVVVNLGVATSAIDTTATALKAAWDATPAAVALATVANAGGNSGAGLVTAMAIQTLSGGLYHPLGFV